MTIRILAVLALAIAAPSALAQDASVPCSALEPAIDRLLSVFRKEHLKYAVDVEDQYFYLDIVADTAKENASTTEGLKILDWFGNMIDFITAASHWVEAEYRGTDSQWSAIVDAFTLLSGSYDTLGLYLAQPTDTYLELFTTLESFREITELYDAHCPPSTSADTDATMTDDGS